jgi:hypothetical protein
MKAETTAANDSDNLPAVESPPSAMGSGSDADSTDETVASENGESSSRSEAGSSTVTVQASTTSIKSTAIKQPPKPAKEEAKNTEGSLVGKINNLVTVDLRNIGAHLLSYLKGRADGASVESREFLRLFIAIPLQIAVGIWFLHALLGWSVWVGVALIILLLPVPGYSSSLFESRSFLLIGCSGEIGPIGTKRAIETDG